MGSTLGLPGRLAYTVAKSGILGMTRTLAVEWGQHGLRINAVAPGYVDTWMIRSGFREGTLNEAALLRRAPLGSLAQATISLPRLLFSWAMTRALSME